MQSAGLTLSCGTKGERPDLTQQVFHVRTFCFLTVFCAIVHDFVFSYDSRCLRRSARLSNFLQTDKGPFFTGWAVVSLITCCHLALPLPSFLEKLTSETISNYNIPYGKARGKPGVITKDELSGGRNM